MAMLNNDKVLVSFRGLCFNQRIVLTQWYLLTGDAPAGQTIQKDSQDIIDAVGLGSVINDLVTPYMACLPPQYSLSAIRVQDVFPVRRAFFEAGGGSIGTNANPATVASDAAALTLRSDVAGRSHISVKKIGPVPDAASAAGILTNAYLNLLGTLGVALLKAFIPAGWANPLVPIVLHHDHLTFDILTNQEIGTTSRVNRRRTVGLGE